MALIELPNYYCRLFGYGFIKAAQADTPEKNVRLGGRLYLSASGWLLLNVPNDLVYGCFDALDEPGVELPIRDGRLNAHISVASPDEIEQAGGEDKFLNDRGKIFHYTLGPVRTVKPEGWKEMSKVWYIEVDSPELKELRRSYGLSPKPRTNEYDFHITIAVRRKKVLHENSVSKAGSAYSFGDAEALASSPEGIQQLAIDERQVLERESQALRELWREGDQDLQKVAESFQQFLSGHGTVPSGLYLGAEGQLERVLQGQLSVGNAQGAESKQEKQSIADLRRADHASGGLGGTNELEPIYDSETDRSSSLVSGGRADETIESSCEEKQSVLNLARKNAKSYRLGEGTRDIDNSNSLSSGHRGNGREGAEPLCGGVKDAEEVVGIPSRKNYGDLSKLPVNQLLDFIIQRHKAERAGEHFDVRFGNPEHGLHSWATRKELPQPGGRTALFHQPLHSHEYKDFEGRIPSGYGAGTVEKHREGKLIVTKMSPNAIHFTMDQKHPERFTLLRPPGWKEKDWLLVNNTPTEALPYNKVRYKKIPATAVDNYIDKMQEGDSLEAKLDGASSLVKLLKDNVEVVSYRQSKQTGRPILYTEKLLGGGRQMKIPPELVGTILKGEVYGQRDKEVIAPQELGGILNSSLGKALTTMKDRNIKLRNMVYDIQQLGNKEIDWHETPRAQRREMMQQVLQHLPEEFHISESAKTPDEARQMWTQIQSGKHPLTREGVVMWPHAGPPMKGKLTEDTDVHITGVYPGEGKYKGVGAGGFEYSLKPGGPTVGRVGTGFSDELRSLAHRDPSEYIGRVARIQSQQQLPSGAYRAPSLLALHEDYPSAKTANLYVDDGLVPFETLVDLGIIKSSDDGVISAVQEIVDGDNPFKDFDGGYGYVLWNPDDKRLHLVTGDWYENEDVRAAKALLDKVDGVDEVTADAEYWDQSLPWTRIRRGEETEEIPAYRESTAEQQALEAGISTANRSLRSQRRKQLKSILADLHTAKSYSEVMDYSRKQQLLRRLMTQAPQDWIVDQPRGRYPGITHVPTNFRFHTSRRSIPTQVPIAQPTPVAPPVVEPELLPKLAGMLSTMQSFMPPQGSFTSQALWNTPWKYTPGRSLVQNLGDHLGRMKALFNQRVNSRQYAQRMTMMDDRAAQLEHLRQLMAGEETLFQHPIDRLVYKFSEEHGLTRAEP